MVGQNLFWLLSITILIAYLHGFNAAYRLDKCRDMSQPISGAYCHIVARLNGKQPKSGLEKLDHIVENRNNPE